MRMPYLLVLSLLSADIACGNRTDLQCEQNSNCDLAGGGVCADSGIGHRWCAYPDASCPSGYRYSDVQVGDGVSGQCVGVGTQTDAGIDAPPDANMGGDKTCKLRVAFVDGKPPFNPAGDDGSGQRQVWVANPDGSGVINVSQAAGTDSAHPSWSPDGTKLAFASNLTGTYDIFIVDVDGTGLTNLTAGQDVMFDASRPVWSPDGTRIAFTSQGLLWSMNANGSGAAPVTSLIAGNSFAWSPDGTKLVFSGGTSTPALYVALIGSSAMPLKINSGNAFEDTPSWTPASKITFSNLSDVFTVNGDATGLFNVTIDATGNNEFPVPFNHGDSIAFLSTRDNGHREIWSIPAAGGPATQVTTNTAANSLDIPLAVSSDGKLLAFSRITRMTKTNGTVVGSYQLGTSTLDGSNLHLFNAPGASNATTSSEGSPEARFAACP